MRRILLAAMIFIFLFVLLGVGIHRFGWGDFIDNFFQNIKATSFYMSHPEITNLIVVGFFAITFSILGFFLARKKNRNQFTWLILCFFFNFWAFLILLLLPASNVSKREKLE
jgi:hypothetical protein